MNPTARLFAGAACFAAWLVLLFEGWAFGGAVHLLVLAGILIVPWREGRAEPGAEPPPVRSTEPREEP